LAEKRKFSRFNTALGGKTMKHFPFLVCLVLTIGLVVSCAGPATPAPTVIPTSKPVPPTLVPPTSVPMLRPGGALDEMSVAKEPPESEWPPLWAFCASAFSTEPGSITVECSVPPVPNLGIGHGWFAVDEATRAANWQAMTWELYLDDQAIDLDAFGAADFDLPRTGLPGREPDEEVVTKLRTWDVLLSNPTLGKHTLRSVLHIDQEIDTGFHANQPGTYELIVNFTIEEPPPTATPAPTPTLAPQAQVVLAFHAALNAGDVELALTYVADDAVMARGPYGTGHGKEELRAIFKQEVRDRTKFKLSNCQVKGNMVACDFQVTIGGNVVDSGKVPEGWAGETGFDVRDGKIHSDL
jgi:hypothetical protein